MMFRNRSLKGNVCLVVLLAFILTGYTRRGGGKRGGARGDTEAR